MKKLLFISIGIAGISGVACAQSKPNSARMTPAPTAAESARQTNQKIHEAAKTTTTVKTATWHDPNVASYKKAGVPESQISAISASMKNLEERKAAIQNDTQLQPEEKKNALAAIELEKKAVLKNNMGATSYKKYEDNKAARQTKDRKPVGKN